MIRFYTYLLLLPLFAVPASAAPVDYTLYFTATSGNAPTSGSFTYDSAVPEFSTFIVEWEGLTFDLTAVFNSGAVEDFELAGNFPGDCLGTVPGPPSLFLWLSNSCPQTSWNAGIYDEGGFFGFGLEGLTGDFLGIYIGNFDPVPAPGREDMAEVRGTFSLTPPTSDVPEPTTWLLFGGGLAALFLRRRRSQAN